jgi:DNA-binding transcriptional ArsR family regulator
MVSGGWLAASGHQAGEARISAVASLIADEHRSQLLLAMLSGQPQTGSALADAAGISRSLASAHLKKLVAGGLVQAQAQGRQRLYSIASTLVADMLEQLILLAPPAEVRSLRQASRANSLRWARMCYDHLAGTVGVAVTGALLGRGLIREQDGSYLLTRSGATGLRDFGIEAGQLERGGRPLLRPCLDWSERRHHLAGSLGAALTSELLRRRWLRGQEASRIVTVTAAGRTGLHEWLGLDLTQLRAVA